MVASAMPKGLKVSIKFTPQAQDDYLHFGEDSGGESASTADLLANDSAANAARVWGLFDESDETAVQNNIGTLVTSNTTPNGDTSFDVGGATVAYTQATGEINISFNPDDFQSLGEGESVDIGSFTYVIRMANGAFSTAVAHIVIDGSNDVPVISVVDSDSAAAGLNETDAALTADGTLTVNDVDNSDTVTMSVTDASVGGDYTNGWTEDDVIGFMDVNAGPVDADTGDSQNISWSFDSDPEAFDFLQDGEELTLTYTIETKDNHDATDTKDVTITITGTNDVADITNEVNGDFEASEDIDSSAGGVLVVSDADHDQNSFDASETGIDLAGSNGYGTFDWDASTGAWTYTLDDSTLDELDDDETGTDSLTVHSIDGTAHTITVTINGADEVVTGPPPAPAVCNDPDTRDNDSAEIAHVVAGPVNFTGSAGNADIVFGSNLVDNINGANGADIIYGFGGNDILVGGTQDDQIWGGTGDDNIQGNVGADLIYGGSGGDTITAAVGDDAIYAGSGNDTIDAGNGSDLIQGGHGADTLTGGTDTAADSFKYLDICDTGDTITDFQHGIDRIDFASLYAGTLGFVVGDSGSTVVANSVTWTEYAGNTVVSVDVTGDTTADLQITLTGTGLGLTATDFIL